MNDTNFDQAFEERILRDAARLQAEINEAQRAAREVQERLAPVLGSEIAAKVADLATTEPECHPWEVSKVYLEMRLLLEEMQDYTLTEEAALEVRGWMDAIERREARLKARGAE